MMVGIPLLFPTLAKAQNELPTADDLRGQPNEAEQQRLDQKKSRQTAFLQ